MPGGGTILFVSPTAALLPPGPGDPRGGRHAGDRRVDPRRARVRAQGGRRREEIRRREDDFARRALASWGANPRIEILGNPELERLAIVSLGLRHPRGLLHANFVVAVLSDLFGIQARSGCFCAGPLHPSHVPDRRRVVAADGRRGREGHLGAKLAFTRLSFNYFISETVFDYILDAVHLLADEGWKLLPLYRFDPDSGLWRHRERRADPPPSAARRLARARRRAARALATAPESVLAASSRRRADHRAVEAAPPSGPLRDPALTAEFERIRWFPLPGEALAARQRPESCFMSDTA